MTKDKFEMTPEGFTAAHAYLKDTGRLGLLEKELSTDGYTCVALANHLYRKDALDD